MIYGIHGTAVPRSAKDVRVVICIISTEKGVGTIVIFIKPKQVIHIQSKKTDKEISRSEAAN